VNPWIKLTEMMVCRLRSTTVKLNQQIVGSSGTEILKLFDEKRTEFSVVNVSTALHRLAKTQFSATRDK